MKSRKPDTAESYAEADFHVLWTIRKSRELLNFSQEGLKAALIEYPSPISNDFR